MFLRIVKKIREQEFKGEDEEEIKMVREEEEDEEEAISSLYTFMLDPSLATRTSS